MNGSPIQSAPRSTPLRLSYSLSLSPRRFLLFSLSLHCTRITHYILAVDFASEQHLYVALAKLFIIIKLMSEQINYPVSNCFWYCIFVARPQFVRVCVRARAPMLYAPGVHCGQHAETFSKTIQPFHMHCNYHLQVDGNKCYLAGMARALQSNLFACNQTFASDDVNGRCMKCCRRFVGCVKLNRN